MYTQVYIYNLRSSEAVGGLERRFIFRLRTKLQNSF